MLAESNRPLLSQGALLNAATVFFLVGKATLIFLLTENLARMGASPETLILTSMIGTGLLAWIAFRGRRAESKRTWRFAHVKHPKLVRAAQFVSLLVPLLLLAFVTMQLLGDPIRNDEHRIAAWVASPSLVVFVAACIGIAYTLRWTVEVRSHQGLRAGSGGG